jgi:hypothetical protein
LALSRDHLDAVGARSKLRLLPFPLWGWGSELPLQCRDASAMVRSEHAI